MKELRQPTLKENRIRQAENLAIFNGFWHGLFYINGQVQQPKEVIKRPQVRLPVFKTG